MQTTTNGHKPVTVAQLATSLKINPDQAISLLSQMAVEVDTPESVVPPAIASQLMQIENDIASYTSSPRLMGEAKPGEAEEIQTQQPEEQSALTLADVKTIAEVNSVSIKLVQDMVDAMQSKYEKLLLQQGYYTQKREQAIANLGSTLATMEAYREKLTNIQKKQDELVNFDPVEFLNSHGIKIQDLMNAQIEFEKKQAEVAQGEPKETPFDNMIESLGKLL